MRKLAACTAAVALAALLAPHAVLGAGQANTPSPSRTADAWITTEIRSQYFLDPTMKILTIQVSTLNGIVTLEGEVNAPEERARAAEIAQRTSGVRDVVNHLVLPGEPRPTGTSGPTGEAPQPTATPPPRESPVTEGIILANIRALFAADPTLSILDIDVAIERGVVRLSGDVPDLSARIRAERLVRSVRGVVEVRNDLSVKR
jgi:osmotically-inducible protein OsmY